MTGLAVDKSGGCQDTRRVRSPVAAYALILFTSVMVVGCSFPGQPDPADRPVRADQVLDFGILYGQNCAGCHGADGKLGPAPPLNDPLFRQIVTDAELESIITNGRNKTLMPAFARENGGTLTRAQIQILVREIKGQPYRVVTMQESTPQVEVVSDAQGTSPKWGAPGEPPAGVPSYSKPSDGGNDNSTASEIARIAVFARACAVCHGDQGQGIAQGDALIHTINDPAFLSLCSDQVLRRYVITGRADLGMPGYADARPGNPQFQPLSDEEITSLVALLASWRDTSAPPENQLSNK
jgi:mono/diheme cytochrome c family protein